MFFPFPLRQPPGASRKPFAQSKNLVLFALALNYRMKSRLFDPQNAA
jgi:hypothetical protein